MGEKKGKGLQAGNVDTASVQHRTYACSILLRRELMQREREGKWPERCSCSDEIERRSWSMNHQEMATMDYNQVRLARMSAECGLGVSGIENSYKKWERKREGKKEVQWGKKNKRGEDSRQNSRGHRGTSCGVRGEGVLQETNSA